MLRKGTGKATLSRRMRIACVAAVAALLLLPATGAWAADSGLNWSSPDGGNKWLGPKPNGYDEKDTTQAGVYNTSVASGGNVVIGSGNAAWKVYGGYGGNNAKDAISNSVTMNGGTVENIYGGHVKVGAAANNKVTMNGGTVKENIYGGDSVAGEARYNTVTMNGGTVNEIYGGHNGGLYAAFNNTVIMNSGTVKNIYGGYTKKAGTWANTVTMNGGTVDTIYGSKVSDDQGNAYWSASNNRVTINGGTVKSKIVGGSSPNVAKDNRVTLSGAPTLDGVKIYGAEMEAQGHSPKMDHFTGNTLVLDQYRSTSKLSEVKNFQFYNFVLDSASPKPLIVDTIFFGDNGKKSQVQYIHNLGRLIPKQVTLIAATNMNGTDDIKLGIATVAGKTLGGATTVNFKWNLDTGTDVGSSHSKTLVATLRGAPQTNSFLTEEELILLGLADSVELDPATKSLLEGRLAGTVALTQAADMLAGQGMSAMLSSVSQSSFSIWGTVGGGTNRYNTGSHINSDGIGFMVGAAWRKCTGPGTLTLSPFFAFGWGNYTSHNSFASVGSVKGKGNTNYQGGGLMARYNHTNTGWYGEASVQLGHVKQDYKTSDFLDNYLNDTKYAINQMYTSMHFGIGKEIALSNCSVLDVYGKYFWTHTGKKDKNIAWDDYKFAAVNSHRARFGARYTYTKATGSGEVKPYAGAAYEYEFNGKGRGTVEGFRIADTRLQGSTGLLEAGIDYAPNSRKWALNVGATGFVGKRRGIMGQLGIRADF